MKLVVQFKVRQEQRTTIKYIVAERETPINIHTHTLTTFYLIGQMKEALMSKYYDGEEEVETAVRN